MFLPYYKHFILGLTQNMETFKAGNPIDLWESSNDYGKLHIDYNLCVYTFTFSIYGAQGSNASIEPFFYG
jgi:hypothetical protein